MTEPVEIALIVAAPTTLASVVGLVFGYYDRHKVKREINARVEEVHGSINSRMDELLRTARALSRLEGQAEGRVLGATERQERTVESERVEDRYAALDPPK